jgi:adenylyl-sulfate kinase
MSKQLVRISTVGSLDDGKSTLIGRLLHDTGSIYEDHLATLRRDSRGRSGDAAGLDLALVTDGLRAEREQNITIDVAYRYFDTPRRKFILADTPGHEQYTRNMVTGASTANVAIVLVDARNGVVIQTRRHAFLTSLLGVPHVALAVNKMDAVGYDETVFNSIRDEFEQFATRLAVTDLRSFPVSALCGENVARRSEQMPWYAGESLLEWLETVYVGSDHNLVDFRFPVQGVLRPNMDYRGYIGSVVSGIVRPGDEVVVLPSMKASRVKTVDSWQGPLAEAFAPMAVTLRLEDGLDIARGDLIVRRHNLPRMDRHIEAMLVWMSDAPMEPGLEYWLKHTTRTVRCRFDEVQYVIDVRTLHRGEPRKMVLNDIGRVRLTTYLPLFFDPYSRNRATGSFIVIHPLTNQTVAAGMIIDREPSEARPATMDTVQPPAALTPQQSRVSSAVREARHGHKAVTVWITGLAGSGKTSLAMELERRLFDLGAVAVVLDGENVRLGLSRELDFSPSGRVEHLRRIAEMARLLNDAGQIVICATISPYRSDRKQVAAIVGDERFFEVHLDASPEWCEAHELTGLYRRAREGAVAHVAGVHIPYEQPDLPLVRIHPGETSVADAASRVLTALREHEILTTPE